MAVIERFDYNVKKIKIKLRILTRVDASLAATASISAHDTIPGHVFSSSLLASSIIP